MKTKITTDNERDEEAFLAFIQEGIDAADRGEFATDEEVEAVFSKYAPKKPKCRKS